MEWEKKKGEEKQEKTKILWKNTLPARFRVLNYTTFVATRHIEHDRKIVLIAKLVPFCFEFSQNRVCRVWVEFWLAGIHRSFFLIIFCKETPLNCHAHSKIAARLCCYPLVGGAKM